MDKIRSILRSKTFGFVALVAIVTAIPLTVMTAQQTQKTKQEAYDFSTAVVNCDPINGALIQAGQGISFSGKVTDNVRVSGTRNFSVVIEGPVGRKEIDTGITYNRLASDPPLYSECTKSINTVSFGEPGKYKWYITGSIVGVPSQLKSLATSFTVAGASVTPTMSWVTPTTAQNISIYFVNLSPSSNSGQYNPVTFTATIIDYDQSAETRTAMLMIDGNTEQKFNYTRAKLDKNSSITSSYTLNRNLTYGKHNWTVGVSKPGSPVVFTDKIEFYAKTISNLTPMPKKGTPTPSTTCQTGYSFFYAHTPCNEGYRYANYQCYDGYKGILGGPTSCKSSSDWRTYTEGACQGRSSCSNASPSPTLFPKK